MNRLPVIVRQHIAGFRILLVFTVLCGLVYPLVMTGIAQVAFHNKANGSMVSYNGKAVGSGLLCQEFVDAKGNPLPQYFQPRPSYAIVSGDKNDYGCDPLYSSASAMLRRNLWVYGVGGLIVPFIGIKIIDLIIMNIPGFGG